ncbi:MAG: hypothetical protein WAM81_05200 [Acidimicrobiia bacterium]
MRAKLLAMIVTAAIGVPAAGALVTPNSATTSDSTTTFTTAVAAPEVAQPTVDQDLVAACTKDGLSLVAKERSHQITVIEQSALDALRPICDAAGYQLPGTPQQETAPVIVQEMTVEAAGPAPTTTNATTQSSGEHEEHESEHEGTQGDD